MVTFKTARASQTGTVNLIVSEARTLTAQLTEIDAAQELRVLTVTRVGVCPADYAFSGADMDRTDGADQAAGARERVANLRQALSRATADYEAALKGLTAALGECSAPDVLGKVEIEENERKRGNGEEGREGGREGEVRESQGQSGSGGERVSQPCILCAPDALPITSTHSKAI